MTDQTPRTTRRTVLETTGLLAAAGLSGVVGASSANGDGGSDSTLRTVGEAAVDGALEVVTQGTWAYVATGNGFAVVDWRNPNRPELVTTVDAPGTDMADVTVDGDLLAVSGERDEEGSKGDPTEIGTQFYDVSDPTSPEFLGYWSEMPEGVHNAYIDGDVAYITRERPFTDSALRILDVNDPTNPTELAEWRVEDADPTVDGDDPTAFIHDVYVQDDLAYLAYWDAGTRVLDVSDPATPVEVSSFGVLPAGERGTFGSPGNVHYVQPSPDGEYVYAGAETYAGRSGGIEVFDVTDLDDPVQVATIEAEDRNAGIFPDTSHNFDVTANRLYTSWYDAGARVYDVTDPANPEQTFEYDPDGSSYWTAVRARGCVVVSDIGSGIAILREDRGEGVPPAANGAAPDHDRRRGR